MILPKDSIFYTREDGTVNSPLRLCVSTEPIELGKIEIKFAQTVKFLDGTAKVSDNKFGGGDLFSNEKYMMFSMTLDNDEFYVIYIPVFKDANNVYHPYTYTNYKKLMGMKW